MRPEVKVMKKTLEVDAKRRKKLHLVKPTFSLLEDDNIWYEPLEAFYYNKNVTKVSKESGNKRCMLFPVYDLNFYCNFISRSGNEATFSVKWYEGFKQIEAAITAVHIYSNKNTNEITFHVLYYYTERGKTNKSLKIAKVDFEFDSNEVVKMSGNTTRDESFKSVGYVLLENICEFLTENSNESFSNFFNSYSEISEKEELDSFNMDQVLHLLSGTSNDINDDDLMTINYL